MGIQASSSLDEAVVVDELKSDWLDDTTLLLLLLLLLLAVSTLPPHFCRLCKFSSMHFSMDCGTSCELLSRSRLVLVLPSVLRARLASAAAAA